MEKDTSKKIKLNENEEISTNKSLFKNSDSKENKGNHSKNISDKNCHTFKVPSKRHKRKANKKIARIEAPMEDNPENDEKLEGDVSNVEKMEEDEELNIVEEMGGVEELDQWKYDEYYPVNRYAVDAENNDRYAKKRTLDEFYLAEGDTEKYAVKRLHTGETVPIFARKKRGEPIIAKSNGQPIYPKTSDDTIVFPKLNDQSNKEIYVKLDNGKELYPEDKNSNQLYAKNEFGDEYPAVNEKGMEYYASRNNANQEREEYLPKNHQGDPFPILSDDEKFVYPLNLTMGNPIYEKNDNGDEKYFQDNQGNEYYGKNIGNREIYAKNYPGTEEIPAKLNNGVEFYAEDETGCQIYPIRQNKGEFYVRVDDREVLAKDENNLFYYAKDMKRNEIYPLVFEDLR